MRICSVPGCDRPHRALGYCQKHYGSSRRNGTPISRPYAAPLEDRLRRVLQVMPTGCWEFTLWTDARGYGRLKVAGKMRKPHRVAYEVWRGPIPEGMSVCHACDNPPCCNPAHLFLGSHLANMQDMALKGRGWSGARDEEFHARLGATLRRRAAERRRAAAIESGFPPDFKHCARCDTFKAPTEFGSDRRRPDGLQTYCRPCFRSYRGRAA